MAIYLFFNVILATSIFLLFKWFKFKGVDTRQAIVLNYFTAALIGLATNGSAGLYFSNSSVLITTSIIGVLFIIVFNIMAATSQRSGVTIASIASKMSVVIPVIAGILIYDESASFQRIIGVLLALGAIIRISWHDGSKYRVKGDKWVYMLPLLLFIGSGIVDSLLKYMQHTYLELYSYHSLLIFSCGIAGVTGLVGLLLGNKQSRHEIRGKTIFSGIILGVVNYGSLYALLKVLEDSKMESGVAFAMINVSVVSLSAISGRILFKEKLNTGQILGLTGAILAILILNLS